MQRDGEHGICAFAELYDLRRDTRRGYGDAAPANCYAIAVTDRVDRFGDIVQIVERFAHAHENNIRQASVFFITRPAIQRVPRDQYL